MRRTRLCSLPLSLGLALLLTACPDTREVVTFQSDPRILRGAWQGVAGGVTGEVTTALAYSPDGSRLFAAKSFETVIVRHGDL